MTGPTRPDGTDGNRPTFWAGPAVLAETDPVEGSTADPPVPLLVVWRQLPDEAAATVVPDRTQLSDLLARGFAQLPELEVPALRALARLRGAHLRLSVDGMWFRLLDGPDELATGDLSAVSPAWRDHVLSAGELVVLVATEHQVDDPVEPTDDTDVAESVLGLLSAACTAGTLVGAHLAVQVVGPLREAD